MKEKRLIREREKILKDIHEHPDSHRHDFNGLVACCTIDGCVDNSLMEAHAIRTNSGRQCDTTSGPCVCGAWH